MNNISRERKCAVVDKKKSLLNYIKSDDKSENTQEAVKRLSQNVNFNIQEELKNNEIEDLPNPPNHSNIEKNYHNEDNKNVRNIYLCLYINLGIIHIKRKFLNFILI